MCHSFAAHNNARVFHVICELLWRSADVSNMQNSCTLLDRGGERSCSAPYLTKGRPQVKKGKEWNLGFGIPIGNGTKFASALLRLKVSTDCVQENKWRGAKVKEISALCTEEPNHYERDSFFYL